MEYNYIWGDTDVILQKIVQWIRESNCYEYGDLVDYAVSEKFDDWFPTVRSQTIFLTAYLRSNRYKPFKKIDRENWRNIGMMDREKFVFWKVFIRQLINYGVTIQYKIWIGS